MKMIQTNMKIYSNIDYASKETKEDFTQSQDTSMSVELLVQLRIEEFSRSVKEEVGENKHEKNPFRTIHMCTLEKEG